MISLVEALNFRCLRDIRQPLGPFHVLVGPNASGKTTFLDVVAFLGRFVSEGLDAAIGDRTQNFQDLVWGRSGTDFELAIEAAIPDERREQLSVPEHDIVRYELVLATDPETSEIKVLAEIGRLVTSSSNDERQRRSLFPARNEYRDTIISDRTQEEMPMLFAKTPDGIDGYWSERDVMADEAHLVFKLGPRKSTLGNLPEDESLFPVSSWLKQFLGQGIQKITLNSLLIRKASPPGQPREFKPDGSNLPWVIAVLREKNPARFKEWIAHLRTALEDLEDVRTVVREDDRHRYLVLVYRGGLEVPSWTASDGTLRLLALTLPAYLDDFQGIYLIEEPENGIHPRAVETMHQSLSSVYNGQVLMATHSPAILSAAEPEHILCFAKTDDGATDIVRGSEHPALAKWQGEEYLGVLFAAGVLS